MDNSNVFNQMLNSAIRLHPNEFKGFDRTKNVQDQLQEMVRSKDWMRGLVSLYDFAFEYANNICAECFNGKFDEGDIFYEGCVDEILKKWNSLEQLWLAFVMKEKYDKVWNDTIEEWE